jgi:hypothetical protein
MNTLKLLMVGTVFALSTGAASAATVYADNVISSSQGSCIDIGAGPVNGNDCLLDRSTPGDALGAPDDAFFSLGDGGEIVLGFPGVTPYPGGSTTVYEITTKRDVGHDEAAEVFSVLAGVESSLGIITNAVGSSVKVIGGTFDSIKLVDVTYSYFASTTSFDGFDVDAVSIQPVPLPAGGLLLVAGLAGFGALRRRQKS